MTYLIFFGGGVVGWHIGAYRVVHIAGLVAHSCVWSSSYLKETFL